MALFTFVKVFESIGVFFRTAGYRSREYLFQVVSNQAMHGVLPSSLAISIFFAGL
jgi:hypothetical protein